MGLQIRAGTGCLSALRNREEPEAMENEVPCSKKAVALREQKERVWRLSGRLGEA